MLGITALDNYWTGVYQAEAKVFRTTSNLPTEWDSSIRTTHPDTLPSDIADYLKVTATWDGATESWEPEVKSGSGAWGYGVFYDGYKSSVVIRNKETKPVSVRVAFDSQITGTSGWTVPMTGLRDGDAISPQSWSGSVSFIVPASGYQYVKILSAQVQISGCMDSTADNYNPDATQSGPCEYRGCTDSTALNYVSTANTDDGSCIERVSGCTCRAASNYNSSANFDDGSCAFETTTEWTIPENYTNPDMRQIMSGNESFVVECQTGMFTDYGVRTSSWSNHASSSGSDTATLKSNHSDRPISLRITPMQGFTITGTYNGVAWSATNASPYISPAIPVGSYSDQHAWTLTSIDGPRTQTTLPADPPTATEVAGCTDSTATNYDSTATTDDGSCVYADTDDDTDDGSTTNRVVGYTHTVSEVSQQTATNPWLFAALGILTLGAGTYYFMRE